MMPAFDVSLTSFALPAIASIQVPTTKSEMRRYRTALCTTLAAAGLDMDEVLETDAPFAQPKHALLIWHDLSCDALRLFAPPLELLDELTTQALQLLNGTSIRDLDTVPIEDVDAATRVMALMGAGGEDASELHANFVAPHVGRYDDDFAPPEVSDLSDLWNRVYEHYIGGTNFAPTEMNVWIARAYAFGIASHG